MSPCAIRPCKTYELRLNVGPERGRSKRATLYISSARKKGRKGRQLARKHKKKRKCFIRQAQDQLAKEVCNYLEGRIFLQHDITFGGEARALFAVRDAFGTPSRKVIVHAAEGEEQLQTQSRSEVVEPMINGVNKMGVFLQDEGCFRALDNILKQMKQDGFRGAREFLISSDQEKPLEARDITQIKDIVMTLRYFFRLRMQKVPSDKAAEAAGTICGGFCRASVYLWRKRFLENRGKLWVPNRGKYTRGCILDVGDTRKRCIDFLTAKADEVGKPNMTADQFKCFLRERIVIPTGNTSKGKDILRRCQIGPQMSYKKTLEILRSLKFQYTSTRKTGYCDGRYRDDVQKFKKVYCENMLKLEVHMPLWTHLTKLEFEERFGENAPEHWDISGGIVEFSIDELSDVEVLALGHRFGGTWSRRQMPEVPDIGVTASDKILLFSQDECIFKTNDDKACGWRRDGVNNHKRKKTEGQGVMLSGFLSDSSGFLTFTEDEMRQLEDFYNEPFTLTRSLPKLMNSKEIAGTSVAVHQYGKNFDGYWDNTKIMEHTKEFLRCVKYRYCEDEVKVIILYDWSSGHAAMAENALVVNRMKWRFGGKQPHMHDATILDFYPSANDKSLRVIGARQAMDFKEGEKPFYSPTDPRDFKGIQKGVKQILWERGIFSDEMTLKGRLNSDGQLRVETSGERVLSSQKDFQWEPCALTEYIYGQGAFCIFTPKFHPELNFIERAWGRAKWFLRLFCDYTFPGLKSRLGIALGIQPLEQKHKECHSKLSEVEYVLPRVLVRKHARISRRYVRKYNNATQFSVGGHENKRLKSHREPPKSEYH